MEKVAIRTAMFIALISFIIGLVSNISIMTALLRSGMVFVGVLFIFFIEGLVMKWGVFLMIPRNPVVQQENPETEE